jgi:hypothetical protein
MRKALALPVVAMLVAACPVKERTFGTGGAGGGGPGSGTSSSTTTSGSTSSSSSSGQSCEAGTLPGCGAAPGTVLWARSLSALSGVGVAETGTGVVTVGYFSAPTDLGAPQLLNSAGGVDTAFAQFGTAAATYQVSNRFGGAGDEFGFLNTVESDGALMISGVAYGDKLMGTYDLGLGSVKGGKPAGATTADGFVGRYAFSGPPSWVNRLVGPGEEKLLVTANGPGSTVLVAGWFDQTATLDQGAGVAPVMLTSAGYRDIVLVQYNTFTGAASMTKVYGTPAFEEPSGLAWTGSSIVMTGTFNGTTTFGNNPPLISMDYDIWVASLMPDGTPVWSTRFGGTGLDNGSALVVDAAGDLYTCGNFAAQVAFGAVNLVSAGLGDVYLVKLHGKDGTVAWATSFGSTGDDACMSLAINSSGQLFMGARVSGPIDPGGPYAGGLDAAILSFDTTSGARRWTHVIGTSADDYGWAVAVGTGAVYANVNLGSDIGASVLGTPLTGPLKPAGVLLKMQP